MDLGKSEHRTLWSVTAGIFGEMLFFLLVGQYFSINYSINAKNTEKSQKYRELHTLQWDPFTNVVEFRGKYTYFHRILVIADMFSYCNGRNL